MKHHQTDAQMLQEAMNGLLASYEKAWKRMGYVRAFKDQYEVVAARCSPATAASITALLEAYLEAWIDMDWSQLSFETDADVMRARIGVKAMEGDDA